MGARLVRSNPFGEVTAPVQKLLVVVPYYEGDKADAEAMLGLVCDLERVKIKEADLFLEARADALPLSDSLMQRLRERFDKVHLNTCRRRDGVGHPFGANQMFFDVLTLFGQVPSWNQSYYAFLFMEPDCVPTRPGWIKELAEAYVAAKEKRNKSVIGFIHGNPVMHVNGVAVYSTQLYKLFPGDKMGGGNPQKAFDIDKAPEILSVGEATPLIKFEYRKATITPAELFAPAQFGVVPCLFHGVKDGSARAAVRARHITFSEKSVTLRPTVYTYYQTIPDSTTQLEDQSILRLWSEAWKGRGFNPVILTAKEAVKNKFYAAYAAACDGLPAAVRKETQMNRFLRWIALDTAGGGLLTDYDVIPGRLTPEVLGSLSGFHLARPREIPALVMAFVDKSALPLWLDRIQNYHPRDEDMLGDRRNVTDINVVHGCALDDGVIPEDWVRNFGEPGWQDALAVHFTAAAIAKSPDRALRKSQLIERFLGGETAASTVSGMAPITPAVDAIAPITVSEHEQTPLPPPEPVDNSDIVQEVTAENESLKSQIEALKTQIAEMQRAPVPPPSALPPEASVTPVAPVKNKGGRPRKHPLPAPATVA
jgi:hypothetical protein